MTFNNPTWFILIPILAAGIGAVLLVGAKLYKKRLHSFIAANLRDLLIETDNRKKIRVQLILFSLMMLFLVISFARPLLQEREDEVKREGVDFMVALDLSRSMLVKDVAPDTNRLAMAKRVLRELMEEKLSGDRVGLIAFAGESRMLSPMTMNYDTLNLILDGLSTESLWPGSDMGKAIKMASDKMSRNQLEAPVLVIISDGESLEGDAVMAAREAKVKTGLTIFTVGVGTPVGGPIEITQRDAGGNVISSDTLKDQNNEEVIAPLDEQSLRTLAQVSGGSYVPLSAKEKGEGELSALCDVYDAEIRPLAKSLRIARVVSHVEVFQVPLGIAILLLFAQLLIFERRKPAGRKPFKPSGKMVSLLLLGFLGLNAWDVQAVESTSTVSTVAVQEKVHRRSVSERVALLSKAEKILRRGDAPKALAVLRQHLMDWPEDAFFLYNYGVAAYAAGEWAVAEASWDKVAMLNVDALREMTLFQLGNVFFRQAFELTSSQQNWNKALMLYDQAEENYELVADSKDPAFAKSIQKNFAETQRLKGDVYFARGSMHLKEALTQKRVLESLHGSQAWKMKDAITELLKQAGKAKVDFIELIALIPEHDGAVEKLSTVNQLLEYGLLSKARSLKKEVEEVGSTQNEVWTVQKYQQAISFYDQVLMINSNNVEAAQEKVEVKEACRDLYMAEAVIEREMALKILKEREIEKEIKRQIAVEEKLSGKEHLLQLGLLEDDLRRIQRRYPSSDPEEAIKHWEDAMDDYAIALTFVPGDLQVKKRQQEVSDTTFQFRKDLAGQYMEETQTMPFTNDEDADAFIKKQELAVTHLKQAQMMVPAEAPAIEQRETAVKKTLARSYVRRAEMYIDLGKAKRVTHFDRAVAYYEKAGQDYIFALRADPSFRSAAEAQAATQAELTQMRITLSKRIAASYEQESEEDVFADEELGIDPSKLRELTLQKGPSRTFETVERPEPVFNW